MDSSTRVLLGAMRWCLALALTANTVVASGQTAISGLAQRSDAIALVEVAFVPYGDLVLVEEVLHGEIVGLTSSNALLGDCLPRRASSLSDLGGR